MKELLKKHIANVFSSLQIEDLPYEVYECEVDILPEWTNEISITHEFLVSCRLFPSKDKLQRRLDKKIYQYSDILYWFEGDRIAEFDQVVIEPVGNETAINVDYLKTDTRLPVWLDDFIFTQLKAEYAPDPQRFAYNLDLTKDENLKYLGTYFPRSYAESFCIFDNIFQNDRYKQAIAQKKSIKILSVGCGTGGDLTGLLMVIEKYCSDTETINILAIDGNKDAIAILENIINKFQTNSSKKISLSTELFIFSSIAEIDLSQRYTKYDFVLSFKMICEMIAAGKGVNDDSYYDFVMKFVPLLSDDGLCVLLDVTTKAEHAKHNPILMNRQVNQAMRELKDYKTLLPLPCSLHEEKCCKNCFAQQHFFVSHLRRTKDISRVVYRIIMHKYLTAIMPIPPNEVRYVIQKSNFQKNINDGLCEYSTHYEKVVDAYKLNKSVVFMENEL